MPSPDNSPPELVFNISNILLSLSRKASIWKNCAFSQPASVPRGLPCSSETEVWVGWYFDTALETVHAQRLPEEPLGKGYPPEGRSERFTGIHSPIQLQEKLTPLHPCSGTQTVPGILSPVSRHDAQHQGFSVSSSYGQDATLFNSSYWS